MQLQAPIKESVKESSDSKYECDKCYMTFSKYSLGRHQRKVHQGVKYDCDKCSKTYESNDGLYRHKKSVHDGIKYDCNQCDKQFRKRTNLAKHIRSMHEGLKEVMECDQCNQILSSKSVFTAHKNEVHLGKKFACNHCDYQNTREYGLKRHIQSKHECKSNDRNQYRIIYSKEVSV